MDYELQIRREREISNAFAALATTIDSVARDVGKKPFTRIRRNRYMSTTPNTLEMIERNFNYYPPTTEHRQNSHVHIRESCKTLAYTIESLCPPSRERSLAITKLEEVMMWANAAIARQEN